MTSSNIDRAMPCEGSLEICTGKELDGIARRYGLFRGWLETDVHFRDCIREHIRALERFEKDWRYFIQSSPVSFTEADKRLALMFYQLGRDDGGREPRSPSAARLQTKT